MKVSLFAALLIGLLLPAVLPAQSCPCTEQFNWLRQKTALNYAGYRDKVTPQKQIDFERFTAGLQTRATEVETDTACLRLMADWLQWFRDGHLSLAAKDESENLDPAEIRARFANWESISLTEARARFYFNQPEREPMEGIYQNDEGSYRIALMKYAMPGRNYIGAVIRADSVWWMPGHVKFDLTQTAPGRFTSHYYMLDHSDRPTEAVFNAGVLRFKGLGAWYKQYPGVPVTPVKPQTFTLRYLDFSTLLLTVPVMDEDARPELDSLLRANSELLGRIPRLVIDCRNNRGGSDATFASLLPYVLSGPVRTYDMQTYASADNMEKYERLSRDERFSREAQKQYARRAGDLRRHEGEFVGKCGESTLEIKELKPFPQRVAILIDGGCSGSCEQFVYLARQSARVTLLGENTAGVFDYGDPNTLDFPCNKISLTYPTSRSCGVTEGKGIDGTGIPPAVRIGREEQDWVQFALRFLNGK